MNKLKGIILLVIAFFLFLFLLMQLRLYFEVLLDFIPFVDKGYSNSNEHIVVVLIIQVVHITLFSLSFFYGVKFLRK